MQLCILLYDERVSTWHRLQELDLTIDSHPEQAALMAELDDRNRQAHHELEVYQSAGVFPAVHPIAVQFLADRKTRDRLRSLRKESPERFLRQAANAEQNVRRLRSQLNKHHYKTEEQRRRLEDNLTNAERLQHNLQAVLNE